MTSRIPSTRRNTASVADRESGIRDPAAPTAMPPLASPPEVVHALLGETMGTRWRVDLCAPRAIDLHLLHDAVQARLDRVVAQMSSWEPDSDVNRYNRAPAGHWQPLPPDCAAVLRCALAVAAASDGAYDPTVAPLVDLWGFGPHGVPGRVPSAADIAAARARVGWQRLLVSDTADGTLLLQPGGVALDLSAIAKGHGTDAAVDALRKAGVRAALVDVGGELRGYGRKLDGQPWRVQVATGDDAHDDAVGDDGHGDRTSDDGVAQAHDAWQADDCVLALDDAAVATSGDRWHAFTVDGRRYAHTLDPRSGWPLHAAPAAVTVVADDAMHADAWATALGVMGPVAGLALAEARGIAARFVLRAERPDHMASDGNTGDPGAPSPGARGRVIQGGRRVRTSTRFAGLLAR